MLYTLRFFSSKCGLFHNANLFGSCIIHILYTGVLKLKKKNSGAKGLNTASKNVQKRGVTIMYSQTPTAVVPHFKHAKSHVQY